MLRVVLRGFVSRKLRAALTGVAIVLGVALMAGTYILTDTINSSFGTIFSTANKGNDVVVTPHLALGRTAQVLTKPITDVTLARVRAVPGVAQAAGTIFSQGALLSGSKRLNGQAPSFITTVLPERFESFSPVAGRFPTAPDEVAVDQSTASGHGLKIGQQLGVAGVAAARRYRIVGIVKFAGSATFGGAGAALLIPVQAQQLSGEPGGYDAIDVAAGAGTSPAQLRERVRAALPATLDVRTGAQQADQQTQDLKSQLGFLRTFLLIFAYVALFVGAFIIFNTISITVAQRTREFGLLRTLGARRRQIMFAVIGEGLLLGVAGSIVGVLAGTGVAPALDQLFRAFGADLPDSGTVLESRTVIVSLLVGTGITLIAGLPPALRAMRVPPIAALREGVALSPRRGARRQRLWRALAIIYTVYVVVRLVMVISSGGSIASVVFLVAIGAFVLFRGIRGGRLSWLPSIMPWLARAIGTLVTWRGVTGRLARDNAVRQPGRTAVTAAALMIGLALVTFVSVLAAGLKASINQGINRSFAGSLIVENSLSGRNNGIPASVAPALRRVPGVATVAAVAFTQGRVSGISGNSSVSAVDPANFQRLYRINWSQGSPATLAGLGSSGTVVTRTFAKAHHLKVGQTLSVLTPEDRRVALQVRGIAADDARLLANLTITLDLARAAFAQRQDALDFVGYAPGATNTQVQPAVNQLLATGYPQAKSRTAAQFKHDIAGQLNSLLAFVYVLLALSIIVSLFGIINTLVLSIYERTRELGMLRAIGTTRRQVRAMIRYESIITALIGGVLGVLLGIVIALISTASLSSQGFILSIPVATLVVLVIIAGLAGVAAAVWPARRAAQVDILDALAAQ